MALVIETGAGVAGANSYATIAEARAFALARGVTLSVVDSAVEVLLIKANDFLESLENQYKGDRVASDQALAWPRDNVYLFDLETLFPNDEIPVQLKNAQCQLAIDAVTVDLLPTISGRRIQRRKVDVIETEYEKGSSGLPQLTKALNAFLAPLLQGGMTVRVIRA